MSDIVERLKAGTGGGKHWMELHEEAAAEIEQLRDALIRVQRRTQGAKSKPQQDVWDIADRALQGLDA